MNQYRLKNHSLHAFQIPFAYRTMAHRGGGGERTENTLVAFKHAHKLGIDLFELDVQVRNNGLSYHDLSKFHYI